MSASLAMNRTADDMLLAELAQDEVKAFRTLADRHFKRIFRLAYRVVGNRQDAEDVAQEVLVTVWNRRHEWRAGEASFSTWIYRVALNRSIDFCRRRRPANIELSDMLADDAAERADDRVSHHETQAIVLAGLRSLPEKQMLAMLYFYYEEMDIPEICHRLAVSEDSARSLLKRAKVTLRAALSGKFGRNAGDIGHFSLQLTH